MVTKIGILGYSSQEFNKSHCRELLNSQFSQYYNKDIEIVSGYTDLGVPSIAYNLGETYNFMTVGIASVNARDFKCYPCNKVIISENWLNWGDESLYFVDYCDMFIRYGGGKQTEKETQMIIEARKPINILRF